MVSYLKSLQRGLYAAFAGDERVWLVGEDVLDPYGGAFKVTAGLSTAFPDRVLTTPISEAGIVGLCNGMALRGLRPIAEIMFGDFITLCADQIVNHAVKFRAMYAGRVTVPLVIRTPTGAGRGYGPTHSQSLEKMFLGIPDLVVVAPSHAHDPGALLRASVESDEVVLFIESKLLYPEPLLEADSLLDIETIDESSGYPTALVRNFRNGRPDVTLVSYGECARVAVPLLRDLIAEEIRIELVLPGAIQPLPMTTILNRVKTSGRALVAEPGTAGFGWSAEVAASIASGLHGHLDAPIVRVQANATVIPAAPQMEAEVIVTRARLEEGLWKVLR